MSDSLDTVDPDKFVFFYEGDFYPVTNMYDDDNDTVADPMRATKAVIYLGPCSWLPTRVLPGEIERRNVVEARLKTTLRRMS